MGQCTALQLREERNGVVVWATRRGMPNHLLLPHKEGEGEKERERREREREREEGQVEIGPLCRYLTWAGKFIWAVTCSKLSH